MTDVPKFNLNASVIEKLPDGFNGEVQEVSLKFATVEALQKFIGKFIPIPIPVKLDLSKPILLDIRVSVHGVNIQSYLKVGEKNE